MSKLLNRKDRQYKDDGAYDFDRRNKFQHDYDRIIYSSSLRRLAEVTQIFNPSEGVLFHNRLTHTLKVSQIGKRLTQHLKKNYKVDGKYIFAKMGGLDEEVVAAAALAHDLGNPPFGHAAEDELDKLIMRETYFDGFEGNAQSFRIVSSLASHGFSYYGMNLTRATLNAILKYPWQRPEGEKAKFGVYQTEINTFGFARELSGAYNDKKCLEAAIMDISDDITYGIHDLLDLIKSDLLPIHTYNTQVASFKKYKKEMPVSMQEILLHPAFSEFKKLTDLLKDVHEEWAPSWEPDINSIINKIISFFDFYGRLLPVDSYRGLRKQKLAIKFVEGILISRFIDNIKLGTGDDLNQPFLYLKDPVADELIIIKALTKNYIINSPSLTKQQCGERRIIQEIFGAFVDAVENKKLRMILPARAREELEHVVSPDKKNPIVYRIIGDAISSLTDAEAISTFSVLTGVHPGSIFDKISI